MADLIDRQALLRDIEKYHLSDGMFQHWVEVQPSVEAEPVRYGHWIPIGNVDADGNQYYNCSICECGETHVPRIQVYYCWNCGARMDGEENG